MEQIPNQAERLSDLEKDTEVTARLLGALGLVDALADIDGMTEPVHVDEYWQADYETNE